MTLPMTRVEISRDAVYSLLAWLRRHREKTGPRSVRFLLKPGESPTLVLDPWGTVIPSRGPVYAGDRPLEIKVWGRRRLMTLARVLPLAEKFEVCLLGSGLPSIWVAHMGEMRFVLALSGWTTNDWTSGAALELLAAVYRPDPAVVSTLERFLARTQKATLPALTEVANAAPDVVLGSLHRLAKQGQVIYDFAHQCYRYRSVMPTALSEAMIGPEHPELTHGQRLHREKKVKITRDEPLPGARRLIAAVVERVACEGVLDADGKYVRAKCSCSYFYKNRLRGGPCRHLLAVQLHLRGADTPPSIRIFH